MDFSEDFLHFIWQFKLYSNHQLSDTFGVPITVINPGILNKDAGPDFLNAQLIIGDTHWAGNVEIHLKSSDWLLHQHQKDMAYDNVILHVVYQHDKPIFRTNETLLPVLVLKDLFPEQLLINYQNLILSVNNFPCEKQINTIDELLINSFLGRVLVERLAQKADEVHQTLTKLKGNWDETFYHFMARSFGFKVNAMPMEMLANALPQQIFAKHKDNSLQIEALLFGQAGFLNQKFTETYPQQLKQEYLFLKGKYYLKPINVSAWKFMRMRPQNFPTIRIAQFAALISKSNHLFSKILLQKDFKNLHLLFEDLPVNNYWQTHYHFNKTAGRVSLQLGKQSINNVLINTISLFLFAYGRAVDQSFYVSRAVALLENLGAETNAITKQYQAAGVQINSAFTSQALLQLKKSYCNQKKCLNCGIGIKILRK